MKTQRDFRGLSEDTQAEVRRQAFRNLDDDMRRKKVALLAEVHCKTIDDWISRRKEFEKRRMTLHRGEKRGRLPNEQKMLTAKEEEQIKNIIETKTLDKAGLSYALWTRKAISGLIKKKCGKKMPLKTVSKYTKRWDSLRRNRRSMPLSKTPKRCKNDSRRTKKTIAKNCEKSEERRGGNTPGR